MGFRTKNNYFVWILYYAQHPNTYHGEGVGELLSRKTWSSLSVVRCLSDCTGFVPALYIHSYEPLQEREFPQQVSAPIPPSFPLCLQYSIVGEIACDVEIPLGFRRPSVPQSIL